MPLSIFIPGTPNFPPNFPYHQDGHSPSGEAPTSTDDSSSSSSAPSEDGASLSGWLSCHSSGTNSPGTSPSSTLSQSQMTVPSRKASTSSLPIFNRPPPPVPPVVRWGTSPSSPNSSSCTLIGSWQDHKSTDDAAGCGLRIHLQTYLDETKLANRSVTINSAASQCAAQKGFQEYPSSQLGGSFQQLLTHATMLDFASEQSNYSGLSQIVRGLDRGIDEFLECLEDLPFELRNMESFISATSDILQAKAALLGAAGQLTAEANAETLFSTVKCCQHERDILLRAIRVFFDIADFESRLQAKLSLKPNNDPEPSPKRRFRLKLPRRQSTNSRRSKLPGSPPISSNPGKPESDIKVADEDEDEYAYHAAMVSDVLTPRASDEYWGVRMPAPRSDALDVLFCEETGSMQSASLEALVYMLTDPQPRRIPTSIDNLLDTFLLCFRSFCDPVVLAKALISRLEEQPLGLNNSQRESWPHYRSLVKTRVLRLINTWIDQYWIHEKDCIAGLHIKAFFSPEDDQFDPGEREEIVRKLKEHREVAISLAPSGTSADQPEQTAVQSSFRAASRQKPIRYNGRLQAKVERSVRRVRQPTPKDDEVLSARALDDLIGGTDTGMHVLLLNSRELCQQLARQLAIFMSEGYLRVVPEDLWYRFGLGHDCDVDIARSTQQAYESALSSWVTGSILDQAEADTRAAVMTFFIALGLRSHEFHNYCAMRNICEGLTHPCLESLSEARLPLSDPARSALERLSRLKESADYIAHDRRGTAAFPRPGVPPMEWYFNKLGTAINTKALVVSPNSFSQIANMERCLTVAHVIRDMEHWLVPYNYPRANHAQAWLLKCLEGAIARDTDKESNWMFKQSEAIEQTGLRFQNLKLPRLSIPFGKKSTKAEWKEATMFELIPELER